MLSGAQHTEPPAIDETWAYGGAPSSPPWTGAGGSWRVQHGLVAQTDGAAPLSLLFAPAPHLADGTLETSFTTPPALSAHGDIGVAFRLQDQRNFYYFSTAGGGTFGIVRNGVSHALPGDNAHRLAGLGAPLPENFYQLSPATTYTVAITLRGVHLTALILRQGQEPYELGADDATFATGGVGLFTRSSMARFGPLTGGAGGAVTIPAQPQSGGAPRPAIPPGCAARTAPGPDYPAPLGDYGDAPDGVAAYRTGVLGRFPTRFDHHGAHTVRVDQEWLGTSASLEYGATDPLDPDGVPNLLYNPPVPPARVGQTITRADCDAFDDSRPSLNLFGGGGFSAVVSVERHAPNVPRYLNVLADMNQDGRWNAPGEWVVRNCTFSLPYTQLRGSVPPAQAQVLRARIACPVTHLGNLTITMTKGRIIRDILNPTMPFMWVRVMLTRFPVTAASLCPPLPGGAACLRSPWLGWDGRGPLAGFPYGEVEDYSNEPPAPPTATPTATAIRRPVITITVTPTPTPPYYLPRYTPTPTATVPAPSIASDTPTATPSVPATNGRVITGISGVDDFDPSDGSIRFCVTINNSVLDGLIYDLELLGDPWQNLSGESLYALDFLPGGWHWQLLSGGLRIFSSFPLYSGDPFCFDLLLPPGVSPPSEVVIHASNALGQDIGTFVSTTEVHNTETATPTATATATVAQVGSVMLNPPSFGFGAQQVGTMSADQVITLTNNGGGPLAIDGVALTGPQSSAFVLGSNSCTGTLPPAGNCTVAVAFDPQAPGNATATLQFTDTAPDSPQGVTLTGTGTIPPSISGNNVDFGTQPVGSTSGIVTITITNTGEVSFVIDGVGISGADAAAFNLVSNTCMGTLAPGASCQEQLTFHPPNTGSFSATLGFETTPQATTLQNLDLSGIGI